MQDIGKRIKIFRKINNLSMSDLARLSNMSRSMISQIEKGNALPSLPALSKFIDIFGVSTGKFFDIKLEEIEEKNFIVRQDERKEVKMPNSNNIYYVLTPTSPSNMEFVLIEYPPHSEHLANKNIFRHEGEEFLYVLEGEISLTIEDKTFVLHEGDSGKLSTSFSHSYENTSEKTSRILIVSNEPRVLV